MKHVGYSSAFNRFHQGQFVIKNNNINILIYVRLINYIHPSLYFGVVPYTEFPCYFHLSLTESLPAIPTETTVVYWPCRSALLSLPKVNTLKESKITPNENLDEHHLCFNLSKNSLQRLCAVREVWLIR